MYPESGYPMTQIPITHLPSAKECRRISSALATRLGVLEVIFVAEAEPELRIYHDDNLPPPVAGMLAREWVQEIAPELLYSNS